MPSLAEKARAEAEETEAEEQEQQPDQDEQSNDDAPQEPAVEPHPAEGLEEPTDQMIAELQAACDEHHDHVRAIMGPFVDAFVPCETCNGIGLAYPQPAKPKLEPAPGLQLCTVCKGPGELETPSTRDGFNVIQCVNCGGKGYVGALRATAIADAQAAVAQFPADQQQPAAPAAPQQPASTDPRVEELRAAGYIVLDRPGG